MCEEIILVTLSEMDMLNFCQAFTANTGAETKMCVRRAERPWPGDLFI